MRVRRVGIRTAMRQLPIKCLQRPGLNHLIFYTEFEELLRLLGSLHDVAPSL